MGGEPRELRAAGGPPQLPSYAHAPTKAQPFRRTLASHPASLIPLLSSLALLACSPEASRERDGGPGADPNNKVLVRAPRANPVAADTTLWPGRAPAPVERLGRGQVMPPAGASPAAAPAATAARPVTPDVPATTAQQRTFDRGTAANPRRPSSGADSGQKPRP